MKHTASSSSLLLKFCIDVPGLAPTCMQGMRGAWFGNISRVLVCTTTTLEKDYLDLSKLGHLYSVLSRICVLLLCLNVHFQQLVNTLHCPNMPALYSSMQSAKCWVVIMWRGDTITSCSAHLATQAIESRVCQKLVVILGSSPVLYIAISV